MKTVLKIIGGILGGISILAVLIVGVGIGFGYIYMGLKQPDSPVALHATSVCSDQDIKTYNGFVIQLPSTDSDKQDRISKMQQELKRLEAKSGFDQDPTCIFIAYATAVTANDTQQAQTRHDSLANMSKQGIYPSNRLLNITSLDSMQDRIDAIKNAGKGNTDSRGSG